MKKYLISGLLFIFALTVSGCEAEQQLTIVEVRDPLMRIESLYPNDERMWEHIFDVNEPYVFESEPLGVVIPHHLAAAFEIARFYGGLSLVSNPETIFIIGPNHYEEGEADIQTCLSCIYASTEGDIELNHLMVNKLVDDGIAEAGDEYFVQEHAIFSHTPFIKNYFPETRIVPIMVNWEMPLMEVRRLSEWLDKNLPEDSLVIASVDFSHYISWEAAEFHDQSAFATILNFDFENIYDLEVDSPSALYVLLELMEKRGYVKAERLEHTNLNQYLSEPVVETTSHQYFSFFKPLLEEGAVFEPELIEGVSILSMGTLPENNTLGLIDDWDWDPDYNQASDNTSKRFLRDIKGREDRFLTGVDYLVFDLNDDECRIETQNGMRISFCKFVENPEKEDEFLDLIKEQSEEADLVYLMYDFVIDGELTEDRKFFVRSMAKKGVDVFIGRGLDDVIPFAYYKGSLLFYSLGEFMTDSSMVSEISDSASGLAVGFYVTPEDYYIYAFPVEISNGYPKIKNSIERKEFFKKYLAEIDLPRDVEIDFDRGIVKIDR